MLTVACFTEIHAPEGSTRQQLAVSQGGNEGEALLQQYRRAKQAPSRERIHHWRFPNHVHGPVIVPQPARAPLGRNLSWASIYATEWCRLALAVCSPWRPPEMLAGVRRSQAVTTAGAP